MIESIAVIFSLLSVFLTVKNNIWCWPTGIIGIFFYSIIFYQNNLWVNMYLQFLFIIQSTIGWILWKKSIEDKIQIKWLKNDIKLIFSLSTIVISIIFLTFFESHKDSSPYIDSITSALSISAMLLLSIKKIDNWIYWILADIIYIYLFYAQGLYLSSALYSIFLLLAVFGLINWILIESFGQIKNSITIDEEI